MNAGGLSVCLSACLSICLLAGLLIGVASRFREWLA